MHAMLTQKQLELANYIENYIDGHGIAPTYADMSVAIGRSKSNVHRYIRCLEERGAIIRMGFRSRAIRMAGTGDNKVELRKSHASALAAISKRDVVSVEALVAEAISAYLGEQ